MSESSESSFIEEEDGVNVVHGNMKVDGNLEVESQLSAKELKVMGENFLPIMATSGEHISFKKSCEFKDDVQFTNGRTVIGLENRYSSAYVGTETLQAGQRLVVGDSLFKITADERKIIADTFKMTLARLDVDNLVSKKEYANSIEAKKVKVTEEFIGQNIFADTIKTNNLYLENVSGLNLQASSTMKTTDLLVGGTATIENDISILGTGVGPNGSALVVNGGAIVANKGIVSHTRNNRFQTMQIMGSGTDHDICFRVDRNVDSLFEGDVTIESSRLVLDKSKLVTDNVIVSPLNEVKDDEPLSGVMLTTSGDWETYRDEMTTEVSAVEAPSLDDDYDPVAEVQASMERTATNYEKAHENIKSLISPIQYINEQRDKNIPKKFLVKNGVYRIDNTGNALLKNVVAEKGTFSQLDAYKFNVNRLHVDKLVTTSVASNVVDTDNLLKSRGIAEFDGAVNSKADIFIEDGSKVNVASGTKVTFETGSQLTLRNGAKFEMGSDTKVKMSGDMELDLAKLVFFDSTTNRRYKISFVDAPSCEGSQLLMTYERLPDATSEEIAE